ncbi:hypothetical protein TYRP_022167 [Tyrophagus putrescentiae]|nr:hypothetical protein TYRP_022167 [Tyrophagus putrescentiae]
MSCGLQQQHSRSRQHSIIVSRQHSRIQHISTLIDVAHLCLVHFRARESWLTIRSSEEQCSRFSQHLQIDFVILYRMLMGDILNSELNFGSGKG